MRRRSNIFFSQSFKKISDDTKFLYRIHPYVAYVHQLHHMSSIGQHLARLALGEMGIIVIVRLALLFYKRGALF